MRSRFVVFCAGLLAAIALAVSSAVAQPAPAERNGEQGERNRPRVMTLEGRGAQIGVTVEDTAMGVRIAEVEPESPASLAGLRSGDVVLEVDGERVRSARQFARLIQETAEGGSAALAIERDGQRQSLKVTPETRGFGFGFEGEFARSFRELEPRLREIEPRLRELEPRLREFRFDRPLLDWFPPPGNARARLGIQVSDLTPQLAEYFGAADGGVLVSSVTPGSAAEEAGLRAGDVITSIDGDRVRRTEDVMNRLRDRDGEVTVGIVRERKESTLKATLQNPRARAGIRRPA